MKSFNRKRNWKFHLAFVIFLAMSNGQVVHAETCPEYSSIIDGINKRQDVLDGVKAGLEKFAQGDTSGTLPLTALFTVNLDDPTAIKKRVGELSEAVVSPTLSAEDARALKCLGDEPDGKKLFALLQSSEKDVNGLRLSILKLPGEQRDALFELHRKVIAEAKSIQEIVSEKEGAERRSVDSAVLQRQAESQAKDAVSGELRELAAARALLEKRRKEIADLSIARTEQLETLTLRARRYSDELAKDSALLIEMQNTPVEKIFEGYNAVAQIWRDLVDILFVRLAEVSSIEPESSLPNVPAEASHLQQDSAEIIAFREAYDHAVGEELALNKLKDRIEKEESAMLYGLLLSAGRLRAQFIGELEKKNKTNPIPMDNDYFKDLLRELRLIPYRPVVLFKAFLLETRNQLGGGPSGLIALGKNLFLLLFFVLLPFLSFHILKKASASLETFRLWLISSRGKFASAQFYAKWIKYLNPYLPWVILRIATWVGHTVVAGSEIEVAAEILPYFDYFIYYRIFRLALSQILVAGSSTEFYATSGLSLEISRRVEKTAKFIGLFFFISACLLKATEAIARKAFFYSLIWDFVIVFTPVWLATAAFWWRRELSERAFELLPQMYAGRISRLCLGKWSWLVCLPTAIALFFIILTKKIFIHVSRFDSAKRVSAHIFRKRVESSIKNQEKIEIVSPGMDYRAYFQLGVPSDSGLIFTPESSAFPRIAAVIDSWLTGSTSQNTVAIQGDKGIGKSCLMKQLETKFHETLIVRISIPGKITDTGALYRLLNEAIGIDFSDSEGSILQSRAMPQKTLILIDEAQNLFLAKRKGFAAFRAFIDLCNLRTENIFWCVTVNRYAWVYLNAVTGGAQYFRRVFYIDEWNDTEIRQLIMSRHEKTGYALEFDPTMQSLEAPIEIGKGKMVEDRFFEMLWDQSKGNPRTATILWLSALNVVGDQVVRVGLPKSLPSRLLSGLTDDELFVISAVIRHENLTTSEAELVTNLSPGLVRQALRMGLDRGLLEKSSDDRFRVVSVVQGSLTQSLVHKNFVYG